MKSPELQMGEALDGEKNCDGQPEESAGQVSRHNTLLPQTGLLGDIFNDSMLLAYFSDKLIRRHVILDHAQSGELRGNGRVLHRLFHGGNERFRNLRRHSGWCEKGEPDAKEVLAITEFRKSRDLGIFRNLTRGEYSLHASAF